MTMNRGASVRARMLGASALIALSGMGASPALARCLVSGTSATCDTTAPNPDTGGAALGNVTALNVLPDAVVTSATGTTIGSTATTLAIANSGTIGNSNATGRAINIAGAANSRAITLTNAAGALVQSADDAFRINYNPTGGSIRVDNFGIIRTTNGGQALDFDAAASGSATIIINNYAGAELRSFGQDAIRPGQGATVTNAGLIYSDGLPNNSYDGIDWQGKAGVVVNQGGGVISGLRHGITSDVDVNVTNALGATITGRNGSGIGSDGTGTVVNFGTITGTWDGVAINGDGDGVDIDFIGTVRNFGTIQGLTANGVDSGGRPNSAEGIAMGGGTIENAAGATITGGARGILINHDTNVDGVADGATTVTNAGTIRGINGAAISFVGNFADSITNSGTISGGGGTAIDMGAGDDSLTLLNGSVITGKVDGGAGIDIVTLAGTGGSFDGTVNFERLNVTSGNWIATFASSYANGTSVSAGANLIGDVTTLTGTIANAGTVTLNQGTNGTLSTTITGAGTLVKTGAGVLTIGSLPGFTGSTLVNAGRLYVTGSLPSSVSVAGGATLSGIGSVGATSIQNGGTIAPGIQGSIGTLTVNGAFAQAAGSTYVAEVNPTGTADRIIVNGAAVIQAGARLTIARDAGSYAVGTRYTLLTASGGVTGTYTLTPAASGDTELRLGSGTNALFVDVARTALSLPAVAQTPNQIGVATALGGLTSANAAYAALTLISDAATVRAGFNQLSGEIHASLRTGMVHDAQSGQQAVLTRLADDTKASGVWGQALLASGDDDGQAGAADVRHRTRGGLGGIDIALGSFRLGVAGGYTRDRMLASQLGSRARLKAKHLLAYVGGDAGGVRLSAGVGYDWTRIRTRRTIGFTGFSDLALASYDGKVLHGFAQIGVPLALGAGTVEPFAGVSAYRVDTDAFAETGGSASLRGAARKDSFVQSAAGVKVATPIIETLSARGSLAWEHVFKDQTSLATLAFNSGGAAFGVNGTALSSDAAAASLALVWEPVKAVKVSLGYDGHVGGAGTDSAGRFTVSFGF